MGRMDLDLSELTQRIEIYRNQLVDMYLAGDSLTSETIVSLSQKLDGLLNLYTELIKIL
ncbi:Spo0E family sporulation regulatory protein-aspartic acid phosphatase [Paenibacillus aestuarii]|uniref:Spo0E family sporulation regulatory protein-aspartic acid phosphatase n=2 Tax=Paenibacillus aestuarii TaxID=516965 RepID=A0ABW0KH75_9BACL